MKIASKTFFLILFWVTASLQGIEAKSTIWVYNGPGVSSESLMQTVTTLLSVCSPYYEVKEIGPQEVINENWEEETQLFVIPGGADLPYCRELNGKGNQKITSYVKNGGSFLGICAGAYYAGNYVDFASGTELEVIGSRELAFFPGIVRGPILAPYDYRTNSGSRATEIHLSPVLQLSSCVVFYNGGGYFVDAGRMPSIIVLATYPIGPDFASIVECRCGQGKAILSGVHFEYDTGILDDSDPDYQLLIPALENSNQERLVLIQQLLKRLNILLSN